MYDKCNSGKNLFGGYTETKFGYYDDNGTFVADASCGVTTYQYISLKPNTTYTISYNCDSSSPNNYARISEFTSSKSHIKRTLIGAGVTSAYYSYTFTTTSTTEYIAFGADKKGTGTPSHLGNITNIQIEQGSTATPYEPYPFYTNAGTGTFIAGNPVYNDIEVKKSCFVKKVLPDGYTELEYITWDYDQLPTEVSIPLFKFKDVNKIEYTMSTDDKTSKNIILGSKYDSTGWLGWGSGTYCSASVSGISDFCISPNLSYIEKGDNEKRTYTITYNNS